MLLNAVSQYTCTFAVDNRQHVEIVHQSVIDKRIHFHERFFQIHAAHIHFIARRSGIHLLRHGAVTACGFLLFLRLLVGQAQVFQRHARFDDACLYQNLVAVFRHIQNGRNLIDIVNQYRIADL